MTVAEKLSEYSAHGGIRDSDEMILGFDLSGNHEADHTSFTAACEGIYSVEADISPRIHTRDFVDGDKNVPASDRARLTIKFAMCDDPVCCHIISCARNNIPLRCVYIDPVIGCFINKDMLAEIICIRRGDIYGTEVTAILS